MITIVEYLDEDEESTFGKWFADIDVQAALRVRRAIARMEQGNFGDSKSVGQGVIEYRITFGPGYRIYYGRDGDELVLLLCGGTKQRQQNDIEKAHQYWADYKARKGEA
ncbi:MAG: type II toxin-antitoxin system RelE/ParE family toxin [Pseudomonadota bacterium]